METLRYLSTEQEFASYLAIDELGIVDLVIISFTLGRLHPMIERPRLI